LTVDGDLSDWPEGCHLPDLAAIGGVPGGASVLMAWDERGLYFAVEVRDQRRVQVDPKRPHRGDALFLWIDTRDVRDAQRAGRFCHHFVALPLGGQRSRKPEAAWQAPIPRAREQAPMCRPSELQTACDVRAYGYSLELAIAASALNGFDPSEFPRLGLAYMVSHCARSPDLWPVPPHLPFGHDPSTWATIDLVR
jgi:hypothetical protein